MGLRAAIGMGLTLAVVGCSAGEVPVERSSVDTAGGSLAASQKLRNPGCLSYGPSVVELRGRLTIVKKFGPPNFGESPQTDQKLEVPLLSLATAVDLCPDPRDSAETETIHGVKEIQLNFEQSSSIPTTLLNMNVEVAGTLYPAVSGYHFYPAVLRVSRIALLTTQ